MEEEARQGDMEGAMKKAMRLVDESRGKMKGGAKMAKKKMGVFWKCGGKLGGEEKGD